MLMRAEASLWWPWGVLIVASFVIQLITGFFRAKRRSEGVSHVAQALGFSYTAWLGPESVPKIGTDLFQKDAGGTCKNVMTGKYAGMGLQIFDYSTTTGSPQNSTTTSQTVAVYTQDVELPHFTMQPENLALKVLATLQHRRVALDCPPGVSQHYLTSGPDKDRIRALFNSSLFSFVEGLDRGKGWHIEVEGKTLVLYRYNKRVKPEELRGFVEETASIAQSFFSLSGVKAALAR